MVRPIFTEEQVLRQTHLLKQPKPLSDDVGNMEVGAGRTSGGERERRVEIPVHISNASQDHVPSIKKILRRQTLNFGAHADLRVLVQVA